MMPDVDLSMWSTKLREETDGDTPHIGACHSGVAAHSARSAGNAKPLAGIAEDHLAHRGVDSDHLAFGSDGALQMTPPRETRSEGIMQMIDQIDQKHEEGHKRLREDLRELIIQHDNLLNASQALRDRTIANENLLEKLRETPPNVENVIMTPRVLVAIVVFTMTVVGGVWSSTYGLRSDVRDILTRMEAQKLAVDSAAKLQEVQATSLRTAVDDMKRRQELQQYEIQNLKEVILTGKGRVQ